MTISYLFSLLILSQGNIRQCLQRQNLRHGGQDLKTKWLLSMAKLSEIWDMRAKVKIKDKYIEINDLVDNLHHAVLVWEGPQRNKERRSNQQRKGWKQLIRVGIFNFTKL